MGINLTGFIALIASLVIHVLVVAGLWYRDQSIQETEPDLTPGTAVYATLMKLEANVEVAKDKVDTSALDRKRRIDDERKKTQRLKAEKEKIRLKKQADAEALAKQQREREIQEEALRMQLQEEERLQKIKDAERLEQEVLAQQQVEEELLFDSEIDLELEFQRDAEYLKTLEQRIKGYQYYIYQQVRQQWIRPHSARNGMAVTLSVNLVPTGYLTSVNVINSSGDDGFDRSALQAVKKAAPYTQLQQLESTEFERFFRNFKLLFNPQDLRQ